MTARTTNSLISIFKDYYMHIIFFIALTGTLMSLYYSEVEELTPCILCWYQRILLYPVTIIAFISIVAKDIKAWRYILPMSLLGMVFGAYNYALQKTDWFETLGTCSPDNPCSKIDLEYLGFITIPFMSFVAFWVITMLILVYIYWDRKSK